MDGGRRASRVWVSSPAHSATHPSLLHSLQKDRQKMKVKEKERERENEIGQEDEFVVGRWRRRETC